MKRWRIQFYVNEAEYIAILEHCKDKDRTPENLARHSLHQFMKRYPLEKRPRIDAKGENGVGDGVQASD